MQLKQTVVNLEKIKKKKKPLIILPIAELYLLKIKAEVVILYFSYIKVDSCNILVSMTAVSC